MYYISRLSLEASKIIFFCDLFQLRFHYRFYRAFMELLKFGSMKGSQQIMYGEIRHHYFFYQTFSYKQRCVSRSIIMMQKSIYYILFINKWHKAHFSRYWQEPHTISIFVKKPRIHRFLLKSVISYLYCKYHKITKMLSCQPNSLDICFFGIIFIHYNFVLN